MNFRICCSVYKTIFLSIVFIPLIKVDIEKRLIPNIYPLCITVFGFLFMFLTESEKFCYVVKSSFFAFFITLLIMVLMRLLMDDGFGMGDVKLMLSLSWFQGMETFFKSMKITMLLSLSFVLFMLTKKRISRDSSFPFAPFIALGTIASQYIECI